MCYVMRHAIFYVPVTEKLVYVTSMQPIKTYCAGGIINQDVHVSVSDCVCCE